MEVEKKWSNFDKNNFIKNRRNKRKRNREKNILIEEVKNIGLNIFRACLFGPITTKLDKSSKTNEGGQDLRKIKINK